MSISYTPGTGGGAVCGVLVAAALGESGAFPERLQDESDFPSPQRVRSQAFNGSFWCRVPDFPNDGHPSSWRLTSYDGLQVTGLQLLGSQHIVEGRTKIAYGIDIK